MKTIYKGNIPQTVRQAPQLYGRIIMSFGRQFIVEQLSGQRFECVTRHRRTDFVCGDWVEIMPNNAQQAVIENHLPRDSLLFRSDAFRSKLIAANVTKMAIVVAASPCFSEDFLSCCLIAAEAANIEPVIVLNKIDLPETQWAREQLHLFQQLGYSVIEVSAHHDISLLINHLENNLSILIGQSGMGKSSLTNALIPHANAKIGELSRALNAGKHTTTHATLYAINEQTALIDSPGLQEFGLYHLDFNELSRCFPEFREHLGQCRFQNCQHKNEPDCAILTARNQGSIHSTRLNLFHRLTQSRPSHTTAKPKPPQKKRPNSRHFYEHHELE